MKIRFTKALAVTALAAVVAMVLAQEEQPPQPPAGGPPQGGFPGGQRGGMRSGGPRILMQADVQKELKLTDDQISQVKSKLRPPRRTQDSDTSGAPAQMPTQKAQEAIVKGILTDTQFTRYKQLELQAAGPQAFLRPEIVKALTITDDQKDQIKTILESNRPTRPTSTDGSSARPDFAALNKKVTAKILAILTDDQVTKYKAMIGKEFKFKNLGGPGGPGMGGPGGPGMGGPGGGPGMGTEGGPGGEGGPGMGGPGGEGGGPGGEEGGPGGPPPGGGGEGGEGGGPGGPPPEEGGEG